MAEKDDDEIFFADEENGAENPREAAWKVIVADDEPSVHLVTQLALGGFQFDKRGLELLSAYDEKDVRALIQSHADTALILLDVVMDTATSGFDLVKYIREDLKNKNVRIILRTGQSGHAPEDKVIIDYDINDFKDKTELTVAKLRTAIIASLRSYRNQLMLDNSKNYLQQVINNTASILITTDHDFRVKLWNAKAERIFGLSSLHAAGKVVLKAHPWLVALEGLLREAFSSWAHSEHLNVPFLDDGRQTVNVSVTPMENAGEKELLIRIDDVTTLRRKEEQIALMERMNTLSSVREEWDTQLRDVSGEIAVILDAAHEKCADDFIATLQKTQEALERIVSRTPDRDIQEKLRFQNFKLDPLLGGIVQDLRLTTSIPIRFNIQDEEAYMIGDTELIGKSLRGIIENAIAACVNTPTGGSSVHVSLDRTWVSPEWQRMIAPTHEKAFLRVSITDNGHGMSPQIRRNVFNPFFRPPSDKPHGEFSLNKIFQIVQIHMGFINIESAEGEGTTVQVFLPEEKPHFTEGQVTTLTQQLKGTGTILVCDDEIIMRQVASNILRRFGFQILTAEDGPAALEIVRTQAKDLSLVILDLMMPGPGGLEVFQQIHTLAPHLPVLLSSGFGENEKVRTALSQGAAGFLQKPYGMEKLANEVFGILEKKQS